MVTMALIQMGVSDDVKTNLDKAALMVEEAAAAGAELVVLPEMFVCPYRTEGFPTYAQEEGGEIWKAISKIASANKVWLIAGSMPEREEDAIYNTCFVFGPEGNQVGKHRKAHMFDIAIKNGQHFRESDTLTPGNDLCVVETPFGKLGIMICFDIRFPEWSRLLADAGAEILIMPGAFNMTTGPKHWELLLRARAVDNQAFFAACSPARDQGAGYVAYGHSAVIDPWGEVVLSLDEKEGILLTTIDLTQVEKFRSQLPAMRGRRNELYEIEWKGNRR